MVFDTELDGESFSFTLGTGAGDTVGAGCTLGIGSGNNVGEGRTLGDGCGLGTDKVEGVDGIGSILFSCSAISNKAFLVGSPA